MLPAFSSTVECNLLVLDGDISKLSSPAATEMSSYTHYAVVHVVNLHCVHSSRATVRYRRLLLMHDGNRAGALSGRSEMRPAGAIGCL